MARYSRLGLDSVFRTWSEAIFLDASSSVLRFFCTLRTSAVFRHVLRGIFQIFARQANQDLSVLFSWCDDRVQ